MLWSAAVVPQADVEEELYDDTGHVEFAAAEANEDELYQDAADTRYLQQTQAQGGVCARALYDYQAGQLFLLQLTLVSSYFVTKTQPFLARNSMLSALYAITNPSVCLSVTWVDQSKTVEVRIVQFSPYVHSPTRPDSVHSDFGAL